MDLLNFTLKQQKKRENMITNLKISPKFNVAIKYLSILFNLINQKPNLRFFHEILKIGSNYTEAA